MIESTVLVLWHDGEVVHRQRITTKKEVFAALEAHPPPTAKGGVAQLSADGRTDTIALSAHGYPRPRWGRHF